jgi:hypothetical protein
MHRTIAALALAAAATVGCARTATVESTGDVDISATPADASSLPAGTTLTTQLDQTLSTKQNKVGDTFTATVSNAVVASNGATVIPAGAKVHGKVTGLDDSDRIGEPAAIRLQFERISFGGDSYPLNARVTSTNVQTSGQDSRDETLRKAGVGAAAGAVLGAIVGEGDISKILLGGAIGAAAGTVLSARPGADHGVARGPFGVHAECRITRRHAAAAVRLYPIAARRAARPLRRRLQPADPLLLVLLHQ